MGVSLGGHSAWQLFFNEPRIIAAVIIVGCPDYMRKQFTGRQVIPSFQIPSSKSILNVLLPSYTLSLSNFSSIWEQLAEKIVWHRPGVMTDRARLSKLQTYTSSNGANFLGSKDFPSALISSIKKSDPKGILFGTSEINPNPSEKEQARLREILDSKIKGKQLLVCSGGADKLVPYNCSEPFLKFLKNATSGWYKDGNVYVEDNVYPGVGHEYSEGMVKDTTRFVSDFLAGTPTKPMSKM